MSTLTQTKPKRLGTIAIIATLLSLTLALILATVAGLFIGGGAQPILLGDPGVVVRFGLPIVKAALNLSMALTIGTLVLAAFAFDQPSKLPPKPTETEDSGLLRRALNLAAIGAAGWALFGVANLLLSYLSVTGSKLAFDQTFSSGLWLFATQIQLGQYLGLNLLVGLLLSLLLLAVGGLTGTGISAAIALAGLVPLALTGHAAGTAGHSMAVNSLGLHLVAVTVWVGGLFALLVLRPSDTALAAKITKRYSTLALLAFAVVAVTGVVSASLRLRSPADLFTGYGSIVLLKSAVLVLLGIFGALYRRRILARFSTDTKRTATFWRLAIAEISLMGIAIGLASALSRTAPPLDPTPIGTLTPAQILTGEPLPPELTWVSYFTQWKPDLLWMLVAALGVFAYLFGVYRLTRRGDKWPVARTVSWVLGMLLLTYITSGALNAYAEYLFSIHMIAHMMLTMAVPLFLVPGAPITLLLRATEKRQDASRGLREWVLWAVNTKYAKFISHPLVAAGLFASSLVVFYFTPIFGWAVREHIGHEWMTVHFLITGYLFVQAIIGIDPGPSRQDYPIRLILLIATLAFHAFFGLSLMMGQGLLVADWFGAMGRTWGQSPVDDQQTGGGIAWGIGELPTAALTLIVSIQWARTDKRVSTRLDRASDRSGNKDIEDYNEMLARLAARDARSKARGE